MKQNELDLLNEIKDIILLNAKTTIAKLLAYDSIKGLIDSHYVIEEEVK